MASGATSASDDVGLLWCPRLSRAFVFATWTLTNSTKMSTLYPDPPTESSLRDARRELANYQTSLSSLTSKVSQAEIALSQLVSESQCAINVMHKERLALEKKVVDTMGYIAPIRRLPQELLRGIFLFAFEDYPCCAWVLSSVCSLWRRMALSMPIIWSKVSDLCTLPSPQDACSNERTLVARNVRSDWSQLRIRQQIPSVSG